MRAFLMEIEMDKELMEATNKTLAIRSEYIRSKLRPVVQKIKDEYITSGHMINRGQAYRVTKVEQEAE